MVAFPVLKGDLMVLGRYFHVLVGCGAVGSKEFIAVNAVHRCIFVSLASIALNHPVDVSLVGLGRLDQGVDEGVAGEECNPAETGG